MFIYAPSVVLPGLPDWYNGREEDEEAEDGDEDEEMLYRVPGSFYFSEQEGRDGGKAEGGHDSHHGRGHEHEHGWIGLFQRLGLHAHHRA